MARLRQQHPDFSFDAPGTQKRKDMPFSLLTGDVLKTPGVTSGTLRGNYEDQKEWLTALGKMDAPLFLAKPLAVSSTGLCQLQHSDLRKVVENTTSECYLSFFTGRFESDLPLLKGAYAFFLYI